MTLTKLGLAVVLSMLFLNNQAVAGTTVKVSLWDKGGGSMEMMGQMKPMGMAMMGADMTMATMGVTLDTNSVAAGEVTFEVENTSKELIHEMILAPVADQAAPLPYLADENRVDEELAGHLGEVSELDPGKSGKLTVTVKPGSYILFCNIPGHYAMGMWSVLTVTE